MAMCKDTEMKNIWNKLVGLWKEGLIPVLGFSIGWCGMVVFLDKAKYGWLFLFVAIIISFGIVMILQVKRRRKENGESCEEENEPDAIDKTMLRYPEENQSSNKLPDDFPWPKFKIVVPNEYEKEQLQKAIKHIHFSNIDTDYVYVNSLAHQYQEQCDIVVDEKLYKKLSKEK